MTLSIKDLLVYLPANRLIASLCAVSFIYSLISPLSYAQSPSMLRQATNEEKINTYSKVALYEYLQGNNFESLTELALLEANGYPITNSRTKAMQASIYLSFDLDNAAFDIFEDKLSQVKSDEVDGIFQTKTWLTLAKQFYKKGNYKSASAALNRLEGNVAAPLQDDFYYLVAQLSLKENDLTMAEEAKKQLSNDSIFIRYINFNQGSYLLSLGKTEQAIEKYIHAAAIPANTHFTPILTALIDKANLALAYLYIKQQAYQRAINTFKRVSLNGIETESAMLGYGWAAAKLGRYENALAIWQQLSQRENLTPYVLEAYIAIAFAYEQLQQQEQAYHSYQYALKRFNDHQQKLTNALHETQQKDFLQKMLIKQQVLAAELVGAQAIKGRRVELKFPEFIDIFTDVATNNFQQGIHDIKDLNIMIDSMQTWQSDIAGMYKEIIDSSVLQGKDETPPFYIKRFAQLKQSQKQLKDKVAMAQNLQNTLLTELTVSIQKSLESQLLNIRQYRQVAKLASAKINDDVFMKNHPINKGLNPKLIPKELKAHSGNEL